MWLTSITHFPEMLLGKRYYGKGQFCMALVYICADGHTIEAFRQRQKGLIYNVD